MFNVEKGPDTLFFCDETESSSDVLLTNEAHLCATDII